MSEANKYPGVERDTLGNDFIIGLQDSFNQRLFNPETHESATDLLVAQRELWRDLGKITVYTSGVFDMLHPDHSGFLLHTKSLGVPSVYEQNNLGAWDDLGTEEQQEYARHALSSDQIRLIVALRADKTTAITKGFDVSKGNSPRPIYSWGTRAFQVAKESYLKPDYGDQLLSTADAVTVYGEHDFPDNNPHHSHLSLASKLQPDVWAIFEESKSILEQAPVYKDLSSVALRYIVDNPDQHYFLDEIIGTMHTSSIIDRIKSS